jgi:hypothetical protein
MWIVIGAMTAVTAAMLGAPLQMVDYKRPGVRKGGRPPDLSANIGR